MEDEVVNQPSDVVTQQPTSDVVETPTEPVMTPAPEVTDVYTPEEAPERVVQNEKTLAETYVDDARTDAYLNKGHGISDWIKNEYNYDQQQAGTMWVAGKINDVATQMSFLEATLNEDMYSELDLQKYFFDTNLATARAYAKEKRHETAYGYYRAAQEKALAEGDLIGWYMPAEANYMLSQWAVADANLKDPNLNTMDKNRAGSVKSAVEGWFNSNNITWRGIECLNSLYLKETIRHNKELERLQDDANKIAAAQNAANRAGSGAGYDLQLRQFEFQNAEMELQWGLDLNQNGVIGHSNWDPVSGAWSGHGDKFGWYPTQKLWAQHNLDAAFKLWGTEPMKTILGSDYNDSYKFYRGAIDKQRLVDIYEANNSNIVTKDNANKYGNNKLKINQEVTVKDYNTNKTKTIKITTDNNQVYAHYNPDGSARLYIFDKDGVAHQLLSNNLNLQGEDMTLKDIMNEQNLQLSLDSSPITIKDTEGNEVEMVFGYKPYDSYSESVTNKGRNKYTFSNGMNQKEYDTISNKEAAGWKLKPSTISTKGMFDDNWVMEDSEGQLWAVKSNGKTEKISMKDTVTIDVDKDGKISYKHADGTDASWSQKTGYRLAHIMNSAETVGYDKEGKKIYALECHDGNTIYFTSNINDIAIGDDWGIPGGGYKSIKDLNDFNTGISILDSNTVDRVLGKDYQEKKTNAKDEYNNALKNKSDVIQIQQSDELINESSKKMSTSAKKKAEQEVAQHYATSSGGSSGGPRTITQQESSKSDKKTKEIDKEDAVIQDSMNIADADLGEKAKEELEKDKERYAKLFGVGGVA